MNSSPRTYVFATNNDHKLAEVRQLLGERYQLLSLSDIGIIEDIPEEGATLESNALQKARYVASRCTYPCFADDTGLEVETLGGAPGVLSARYAGGKGHDSEANMKLLLSNMKNSDNRNARFRTVIALLENGKEILFEGIVNGKIARCPEGSQGFGYDPVFIPDGFEKSFAQMSSDEKNGISHRGQAVAQLIQHIDK